MSARPELAQAFSESRSAIGAAVATAPQVGGSAAPGGDLLRGRLMQCSLRLLLDRVPGSRAALPYLAALEGALALQGASAVQGISQKGLTKIHSQLHVLPLDPADTSIHDLLALVQRALRHQATQQTHQLSPFDPQSTVVITEGSETDFLNALRDARPGH